MKSKKIKNMRTDAKSNRKTGSKETPSMVRHGGLNRILEAILETDYFDRVLSDNTRRGELKKILVILKIASEQGISPL
jgi:hypothetical protein